MNSLIQRARAAHPRWAATPVSQRVALLRRLRGAMTQRMDEIVATLSHEIGKPPMDALAGDVMVTLEMLRFYERHTKKALRSRTVGKPAFLFSGATFTEQMRPHGVALVIAPWNYPFQLAMVPAITALAAGNSVILKCSERAPETARIMERLFRDAGFPPDVIQVTAASPDETEALIKSRSDVIFFTGSSRNGTRVAQQAAALLIPCILELGGKDACLVFDSCNLQRAVEGVCYGAFSNAGQVCVGVKRLYVQRGIWNSFLSAFVERALQLRAGSDQNSDLGPVRFQFLRDLIAEQVDDALARGATLHTHWDRGSEVIPALILSGVPDDALLLTDESFGPVVCIAPFDTEAEAVQLANASPFALGASVFTGDRAQGRSVAAALHAGSCTINDCIRGVGNPYAAFGGNARSGYGRYHGVAGLHAFSRSTTIMETSGRRQTERHWFPFTLATYRALRGLMLLRHSVRAPLQALRRSFEGVS